MIKSQRMTELRIPYLATQHHQIVSKVVISTDNPIIIIKLKWMIKMCAGCKLVQDSDQWNFCCSNWCYSDLNGQIATSCQPIATVSTNWCDLICRFPVWHFARKIIVATFRWHRFTLYISNYQFKSWIHHYLKLSFFRLYTNYNDTITCLYQFIGWISSWILH